MSASRYPGRPVQQYDPRRDVVELLQNRLVKVGCGPLTIDGAFGAKTLAAVKLFQTRRTLAPDGVVGPVTWAALFGTWVETPRAPSRLAAATVAYAKSQIGVREEGPNRGREVDGYLQDVGLNPAGNPPHGWPWCAAFVFACWHRAARQLDVPNPIPKTASVVALWTRAPKEARLAPTVDPLEITAGSLFLVDHGFGRGHVAIIEQVDEEIGRAHV